MKTQYVISVLIFAFAAVCAFGADGVQSAPRCVLKVPYSGISFDQAQQLTEKGYAVDLSVRYYTDHNMSVPANPGEFILRTPVALNDAPLGLTKCIVFARESYVGKDGNYLVFKNSPWSVSWEISHSCDNAFQSVVDQVPSCQDALNHLDIKE